MRQKTQNILRLCALADLLLAPFLFPAALLLKGIRRVGVHRLPRCRSVFRMVGVFPIRDHYFEPQFRYPAEKRSFSDVRSLPGIDLGIEVQLELLERMSFADELRSTPQSRPQSREFFFNNGSFEAGDAEYWYQFIRATKPHRIFEIGSGNSTLMAIKAIEANRRDDPMYACKHVCIEPYEAAWLEQTRVTVLRNKVEDLGVEFFSELGEGDVLFIDSSHVIRPQGDVLFLFLELLPVLRNGVVVHVHDIFLPRDYPTEWLEGEVRFCNEQYLLEAFLTQNSRWQVIGALNSLHHTHFDRLKIIAPFLKPHSVPGSFYLRRLDA